MTVGYGGKEKQRKSIKTFYVYNKILNAIQ